MDYGQHQKGTIELFEHERSDCISSDVISNSDQMNISNTMYLKAIKFLCCTRGTLLPNERKPKGCIYCDGNHWSDEFKKAQDKEAMLHLLQSASSIELAQKVCVHYGESKLHH